MVIHYMLFVAVMDIILVFNRRSVGAYRIRPSRWRKCMSAADMPASVEGLFIWNGSVKVHCYVCFADVKHVIYCFKRRCVGAYRIRPSCWRYCMSAANMPALFVWFFGCNRSVMVHCYCIVRPYEGVCDTPLHMFV